VPSSLPVDLNRERLHAIEAPVEFTVDGSFYVDLSNHGEGVHVHLHLDDALSSVARIDDNNVFVTADSTKRMDVVVDDAPSTTRTGQLKISTGYGAETARIDVSIEPFEEEPRTVAVDESLSKPQPTDSEPSRLATALQRVPGPDALPFVLFVLLAVVIAVAAVFIVGPTPPVLVGVGVVIGGAIAAVIYLLT
jgi:hypothetical protein